MAINLVIVANCCQEVLSSITLSSMHSSSFQNFARLSIGDNGHQLGSGSSNLFTVKRWRGTAPLCLPQLATPHEPPSPTEPCSECPHMASIPFLAHRCTCAHLAKLLPEARALLPYSTCSSKWSCMQSLEFNHEGTQKNTTF